MKSIIAVVLQFNASRALIFAVLIWQFYLQPVAYAGDTGTAIVVLYDSSGSMADKIAGPEGKQQPKYLIANAALQAIADKIDAYARTHKVEVELISFRKTEVPFGKWEKSAFTAFLSQFQNPNGNTPLGETIFAAASDLKKSTLSHKHIVVITDGESNGPLDPARALGQIARRDGTDAPHVYIVAFDVNAKVFDSVRKAGATVMAANGASLQAGLQALFGEKILLENE